LSARTGLSRPTVEDALARLTATGVAEELSPDQRNGKVGRPARQYRFRPEAGVVLGLDIGEHRVVAIAADLAGTTLATTTRTVRAADSGGARMAAARSAIRSALADAGRTRADLWAVTAGTVGVIDGEGLVVRCDLLPDWTGRNLAAQLRRSLACPVTVENDANLAALAENWRGAAAGVDDVIYLLASHRLGAGILIGGRVHRGFGGAAGEIGALRLLHWDSAARHLARLSLPVAEDDLDTVAERIFAEARAGDGESLATVEEFAHDLAAGIAAMASTIDPEVVVIGGRTARGGDILTGPVQRRLGSLCLRAPRVVVSALDDEAVALGAVRTALDHVERQIFKLR
jgi:predicted NBD/HSP70 family sugar kinase